MGDDYALLNGSWSDGNTSRMNERGEWVPDIPQPFRRRLRYQCLPPHGRCGRQFWTLRGYQGHYALRHILALTEWVR
jgi:hypothetical protein